MKPSLSLWCLLTLGAVTLTGVASADTTADEVARSGVTGADAAGTVKPPAPPVPQPTRVPCNLGPVAMDWDFSIGEHGFTTADCDNGGQPVWEWGATSFIPGAPARVWGTILAGNYPNDAGQGLLSPPWVVSENCWLVEVLHYFDVEANYDGCNLVVMPYGNVWEPSGGYSVPAISTNTSYYAWCVDGEPGWTGASSGWRVDCFDLSEFMNQQVAIEFDFGSDESVTAPGWYIARVRVGSPEPPAAVCCSRETGECFLASQAACTESGGDWFPEWMSCDPNPCPPPFVYEPTLKIGPWFAAEPWHNWVAADSIPLRASFDTPPWEPVEFVEFYWDSAGTWKLLGVDNNGAEPWFDTVGGAQPVGSGWSLVAVSPLPIPQPVMTFRAVAHTALRRQIVALGTCGVDPLPPSLGQVQMEDYMVVEDDTVGVHIDPGGTQVDSIIVWTRRMSDVYEKPVPGLSQHEHSATHCVPTATAQCLKYFEAAQGDSTICGGLDSFSLVESLAVRMATNQGPEPGTYLSDWIGGLAGWLTQHGPGYTFRSRWHFNDEGPSWSTNDWRRIRNELERSQDVLLGVFWETTSGYHGGHAITLSTIVNEPLPNGHIVIGFKDPWTASTEWGELDPETGRIANMSGAGGGGAAQIGATLLVCPREEDPGSGGPGVPVYHGPNLWPDPIRVPLPEPGPYFIHVVLVNMSGHAHRTTRVIVSLPTGDVEHEALLPAAFALGACTPNPFWASTQISYALPALDHVTVAIYDIAGRCVRTLLDGDVAAGFHKVTWNGRDDRDRPVAAGVYCVRMTSAGYRGTARLILLK